MIQIENINVSYQQTLALDNITLNLEGPSSCKNHSSYRT